MRAFWCNNIFLQKLAEKRWKSLTFIFAFWTILSILIFHENLQFLGGIFGVYGWDWRSIAPFIDEILSACPFMYCVFHHISKHFQGKVSIGKILSWDLVRLPLFPLFETKSQLFPLFMALLEAMVLKSGTYLVGKGRPPTKTNVYFRALPELALPPPHNSGNLVLFFQMSKTTYYVLQKKVPTMTTMIKQ